MSIYWISRRSLQGSVCTPYSNLAFDPFPVLCREAHVELFIGWIQPENTDVLYSDDSRDALLMNALEFLLISGDHEIVVGFYCVRHFAHLNENKKGRRYICRRGHPCFFDRLGYRYL